MAALKALVYSLIWTVICGGIFTFLLFVKTLIEDNVEIYFSNTYELFSLMMSIMIAGVLVGIFVRNSGFVERLIGGGGY